MNYIINAPEYLCSSIYNSCNRLRHYWKFLALILISSTSYAQKTPYKGFPSLTWPKLYSTEFVKGKDASGEFEKPIFPASVKSLEGKVIALPGYIVPFENGMKSSHFMFSSLPLNACFFCGVGGPETVVEVFTTGPVSYTDKPVQVKGVLRLNDKDPDQMIFVLEKAEVIGEVAAF